MVVSNIKWMAMSRSNIKKILHKSIIVVSLIYSGYSMDSNIIQSQNNNFQLCKEKLNEHQNTEHAKNSIKTENVIKKFFPSPNRRLQYDVYLSINKEKEEYQTIRVGSLSSDCDIVDIPNDMYKNITYEYIAKRLKQLEEKQNTKSSINDSTDLPKANCSYTTNIVERMWRRYVSIKDTGTNSFTPEQIRFIGSLTICAPEDSATYDVLTMNIHEESDKFNWGNIHKMLPDERVIQLTQTIIATIPKDDLWRRNSQSWLKYKTIDNFDIKIFKFPNGQYIYYIKDLTKFEEKYIPGSTDLFN